MACEATGEEGICDGRKPGVVWSSTTRWLTLRQTPVKLGSPEAIAAQERRAEELYCLLARPGVLVAALAEVSLELVQFCLERSWGLSRAILGHLVICVSRISGQQRLPHQRKQANGILIHREWRR